MAACQAGFPEFLFVGPLLAGAACAYTPPNPADAARPSYAADLAACETAGDKEAHRLVMSQGGLFLTYPISLPIEEHLQVGKCMDRKGYAAKLSRPLTCPGTRPRDLAGYASSRAGRRNAGSNTFVAITWQRRIRRISSGA